jgi:ubiquitin C-terminal hydrolase
MVSKLKSLSITQEDVGEERRETEERWEEYKERNNSFIDHMLTGLYRSTVTCEKCRLRSVTYDPFMVISLPLPADQASLQACLDTFFAEEQLQNYFCIGCKRDSQNATLRVSIAQYPEVLAVHLKRFQHGIQSQS